MELIQAVISVCFLSLLCYAPNEASPVENKEAWGYVDVRPQAHMFWWLYYTQKTENYASYPLVIWLQGGPGSSGCGYGNFMEIGPLDVNLKARNSTWLNKANLLFFDNPVGTGFSYVTNKSALTTTNTQIASDLVTALSSVLDTVPEFQKTPLYIFSESYGGKMTVDFAIALSNAVKAKNITCNFKGIALGDSWISPLDSVYSWGPYLYSTSVLGKAGLLAAKNKAYEIKKSIVNQQFKTATDQFGQLQTIIGNYSNGVDWYNILKNDGPARKNDSRGANLDDTLRSVYRNLLERFHSDPLTQLMNGPIRQKLHDIPKNVTWGEQSGDVFEALSVDFMKSVISSVDELLTNHSYLSVNVYSGQLDLIVNTLGTLEWVGKLSWPGLKGYLNATRKAITFPEGHTGGYVQSFKQFSFYWILKAGHMVPEDAPESALKMLDMVLNKKK